MTDLTVVVCMAFDHRACADRLAKFKDCICHCPFVDSAMEVAGTFDLIVQGRCASLSEYNENIDRLRGQIAEFVTRLEANFVAKKIEPRRELDSTVLWLPCDGGYKRVDTHLIDKIIAEGDYMRVHVGVWSCLIHRTMHQLHEQLGSSLFIKLHRSAMIRVDFIERLVNDERRWKARLLDGTLVTVAKSHVKDVMKLMTGESTKREEHSTKRSASAETFGAVTENRVKDPA